MKFASASRVVVLGLAAALSCAPFALAQAQDAKPADLHTKRAELRKMCDEALATLYKAKPDAKATVEKAAGYGCFTSFGMSFFVGGAGGKGLVHSNATKTDTYMNMGQASGGFDFGIKQYREVLVFKDAKTLQTSSSTRAGNSAAPPPPRPRPVARAAAPTTPRSAAARSRSMR